jgi:hypothetical protein
MRQDKTSSLQRQDENLMGDAHEQHEQRDHAGKLSLEDDAVAMSDVAEDTAAMAPAAGSVGAGRGHPVGGDKDTERARDGLPRKHEDVDAAGQRQAKNLAPRHHGEAQASAEAAAAKRRIASLKFDWQKCVNFDRRIDNPLAFKVGCCILAHINEHTKRWRLSDPTIQFKIGGRARVQLRDAGYLRWTRTRDANIYEVRFDQIERLLDLMTQANEERKLKNTRSRSDSRVRSQNPDRTPESDIDRTPESDRHLLSHPKDSRESAKQSSLRGKTLSCGTRAAAGPAKIEKPNLYNRIDGEGIEDDGHDLDDDIDF